MLISAAWFHHRFIYLSVWLAHQCVPPAGSDLNSTNCLGWGRSFPMGRFPINAYCEREGGNSHTLCWYGLLLEVSYWSGLLTFPLVCSFWFYLLSAKIAFHKSWHCILWQRYCNGLTSSSGWRSCQSSYPEQSRTIIWWWKLKFVWNHLCFDTLQVSTRRFFVFVLGLFVCF